MSSWKVPSLFRIAKVLSSINGTRRKQLVHNTASAAALSLLWTANLLVLEHHPLSSLFQGIIHLDIRLVGIHLSTLFLFNGILLALHLLIAKGRCVCGLICTLLDQFHE